MLALAVAEAVTASGPQDAVGWLVSQGPLGICVIIIGYGWRAEHNRANSEQRRGDAERAAKDALAQQLIDKVVPALGESTRATQDLLRYARRPGRDDD